MTRVFQSLIDLNLLGIKIFSLRRDSIIRNSQYFVTKRSYNSEIKKSVYDLHI